MDTAGYSRNDSDDSRTDITFHFRKAGSIIKHNELKKCEIYFCPFDDEDDAAEGLLNIYWKADKILWNNFFAHYFMIYLIYIQDIVILTDEKEREKPNKITWKLLRSDYNMEGLIDQFLSSDIVRNHITMAMANDHEVSLDELKYYFTVIHTAAINVVLKWFYGIHNGALANNILPNSELKIDPDDFEKAVTSFKWDEANEDGLFRQIYRYCDNKRKEIFSSMQPWKRWLFMEFPIEYCKCLPSMIFPNWYIASFCKDCTSARNWAHYADSSRGICLIHKTHDGPYGRGLQIKTCHEYSTNKGRIIENHIEPLLDVEYTGEPTRLNFFEMLGSITHGMNDEWFQDRNGNKSAYYYGKHNSPIRDEWSQKYWHAFQKHIALKGYDWENLKEQRVVLEDDLISKYSSESERKIKYDFDELDGIIWGVRTKDEDKHEIRKIIEELCEINDRESFDYYQAVVDSSDGSIWIEKES